MEMLIFCSVSKILLLITFKNVLEAGTSGIFAVHFSVREGLWSDHLYFFFTLTQCWVDVYDAVPTLVQHLVNAKMLVGPTSCIFALNVMCLPKGTLELEGAKLPLYKVAV